MELPADKKQKVKNMLLYLIQVKDQQSAGHCGFHPVELLEYLEELKNEGKIIGRDSLHSIRYFLPKNKD